MEIDPLAYGPPLEGAVPSCLKCNVRLKNKVLLGLDILMSLKEKVIVMSKLMEVKYKTMNHVHLMLPCNLQLCF